MVKRKAALVALVVTAIVLSWSQALQAQTLIQGRTAAENASAAGSRAPGNMVTAGLAQAQQAAQDARATFNITQTANSSMKPREQLIANLTQLLNDLISQLFLSFMNQILSQAGIAPVTLNTLSPSLTTGTGTAATTDANAMGTASTPGNAPEQNGPVGGGANNGTADTGGGQNGTTDVTPTDQGGNTAGTTPPTSGTRDNGGRGGRRPARKVRPGQTGA